MPRATQTTWKDRAAVAALAVSLCVLLQMLYQALLFGRGRAEVYIGAVALRTVQPHIGAAVHDSLEAHTKTHHSRRARSR